MSSPERWLRNVDADPRVGLRIRGGWFTGVPRRLLAGEEVERARAAYCGTVRPFDYVACFMHRGWRPTRDEIADLVGEWFRTAPRLSVARPLSPKRIQIRGSGCQLGLTRPAQST